MEQKQPVTAHRAFPVIASFSALFAYAAVLTMPQASVNQLGAEFRVTNTALGSVFRIFMVGFLAGAMLGGRLCDKLGKLPAIAFGCCAMSAGMVLFSHAHSFGVLPVAAFMCGFGGALAEVVSMALVSDITEGSNRTVVMNAGQVVFSVGAFVQPLIFAKLLGQGLSWRTGYLAAAAISLLCALIVAGAAATSGIKRTPAQAGGHGWWALMRDTTVLRLAFALLLYVGSEIGLASWVAAYLKQDLHSPAPLAAASVAVFWVGIGVGRIAGAGLARRMSDHALIGWSFALGAVFQATLLLMHMPSAAIAVVFLAGVALGPCWPTIVSQAGGVFPGQSGAVIGIVAAFGCAGAAIVPSLVGWASDSVGLRTALWICVAGQVLGLAAVNVGRGSRAALSD